MVAYVEVRHFCTDDALRIRLFTGRSRRHVRFAHLLRGVSDHRLLRSSTRHWWRLAAALLDVAPVQVGELVRGTAFAALTATHCVRPKPPSQRRRSAPPAQTPTPVTFFARA